MDIRDEQGIDHEIENIRRTIEKTERYVAKGDYASAAGYALASMRQIEVGLEIVKKRSDSARRLAATGREPWEDDA